MPLITQARLEQQLNRSCQRPSPVAASWETLKGIEMFCGSVLLGLAYGILVAHAENSEDTLPVLCTHTQRQAEAERDSAPLT